VEGFLKTILPPIGGDSGSSGNGLTHLGLLGMPTTETVACLEILAGRELECLHIDCSVETFRDLDVTTQLRSSMDEGLCRKIVRTLPTLRKLQEFRLVLRDIQSLPFSRPCEADVYRSVLAGSTNAPVTTAVRPTREALLGCVPHCPKLLRAEILTVADDGLTLLPFLDAKKLQRLQRYCLRHSILPQRMGTPVAMAPTNDLVDRNNNESGSDEIPVYLWPRIFELAQRRDDAHTLIFECLVARGCDDILADAATAVQSSEAPLAFSWEYVRRNMKSLCASLRTK
jgi:hypothetical protein